MPNDVERRLLTMYVEPEFLARTPGEGGILNLGKPFDQYQDDWVVVSHTLTLRDDGSGLMSVMLERR